ncbi:MAG: electron transfer flavoprotein subunit beta/FixA family protein [Bacillota bacterium]|nr:electron transfer flavoprotein subunit beta/FixA family protein [Bacillota bacterium]
MRYIVCIKQVPDTTEVQFDPETKTLRRDGIPSIINPFDAYALEEALRFREANGGIVTVVTMGPPQAEQALREAIAMGCDDAWLLTDPSFRGADTLATARTLAAALRLIGECAVILCGKQAVDGDTAQVGPEIAELLDVPHVTYVRKVRELTKSEVIVERMVEGGYEVVQSSLPVLLTVVKDINQPRLPTMRGIMRAKRTPVTKWGIADLGLPAERAGLSGSATEVIRVFTPQMPSGGEMIEGDPEVQVRSLISRLLVAGVV